jgi:hypothetical protein
VPNAAVPPLFTMITTLASLVFGLFGVLFGLYIVLEKVGH